MRSIGAIKSCSRIAAILIILHLTPALSSAADKASQQKVELENTRYEIVDTDVPGVKKYIMEADLKATPEQVCGVVCDYYNMHTYMPREFDSKVVKQDSNQITLDVTLRLPWPFEDLKSLLLIEYNKQEGNAKWHLIDGNIKQNDGTIVIEKRGNYSHLKQVNYLDIGRYYPDWFIKIYSRSLTYKVMRAIRNRLEEQTGTYSKNKLTDP
jgi:hypothetical protein